MIGIGLIVAEIFFLPGFGVAGISGLALLLTGLTISMLPNKGFDFTFVPAVAAFQSFAIILMSMTGVLILFLFTSRMMASSPFFRKFTLSTEMTSAEGYTTAVLSPTDPGVKGKAVTDLRPSGKIDIDGVIYSASAESGYIVAGSNIEVVGNRPGIVVRELLN
jgi:membrane-bound serine protease (ClpP class)